MLIVTGVGLAMLILGVLLAIPGVPGPGLLLSYFGLVVLATEHEWAQRWLAKFTHRFKKEIDRFNSKVLRRKPHDSQ